jgi:hypothetical protein
MDQNAGCGFARDVPGMAKKLRRRTSLQCHAAVWFEA